jgi:hypothetical protein
VRADGIRIRLFDLQPGDRAYAPRPGELVLVRPDGYVALRGLDPSANTEYLRRFRPAPDYLAGSPVAAAR